MPSKLDQFQSRALYTQILTHVCTQILLYTFNTIWSNMKPTFLKPDRSPSAFAPSISSVLHQPIRPLPSLNPNTTATTPATPKSYIQLCLPQDKTFLISNVFVPSLHNQSKFCKEKETEHAPYTHTPLQIWISRNKNRKKKRKDGRKEGAREKEKN